MLIFEDPGQDFFGPVNLRELKIDEAYLLFNTNQHVWLYGRSDDCSKCAFKLLTGIESNSSQSYVINTKHGWTLRFRNNNESVVVPDQNDTNKLCQLYTSFGEFGVYNVSFSNTSTSNCSITTAKEPVDIYMPLLACFLFYVIIAILWTLATYANRKGFFNSVKNCWKKKLNKQQEPNGLSQSQPMTKSDKKSQRLKSLDVFRGISIVIMIFVNDGAGQYWFFEHATWNGLLVADLVFPWFLWIMGACMPISLQSAFRREEPKISIFINILRRSCILFLLGLMVNTTGGWINLDSLRLPGVLQRFAISYFVVGIVGLLCLPKKLAPPESNKKWRLIFHDIIVLIPQWIIMLVFVALHCCITFLLPVENCPVGYLGPGGLHMDGIYDKQCIGGSAGYIDRWLLTDKHIYNWPTARAVYDSGPYDPEGILGSLLSIFQVFLGFQAGTTLLIFKDYKHRILRWLSWSLLTGIIGTILCKASQDDGWIPINKNLWSLSFVMITSCFAFLLLSFCYYFIDVRKWWNGAPFFYPGMNAILMYIGHNVAFNLFPWHWQSGEMNTHFERLVENLWGTTLWVLISTWLYHIKFFLTI